MLKSIIDCLIVTWVGSQRDVLVEDARAGARLTAAVDVPEMQDQRNGLICIDGRYEFVRVLEQQISVWPITDRGDGESSI